jgi:hypothetical protein
MAGRVLSGNLQGSMLLFKSEGEPAATLDVVAPFTKEQHALI